MLFCTNPVLSTVSLVPSSAQFIHLMSSTIEIGLQTTRSAEVPGVLFVPFVRHVRLASDSFAFFFCRAGSLYTPPFTVYRFPYTYKHICFTDVACSNCVFHNFLNRATLVSRYTQAHTTEKSGRLIRWFSRLLVCSCFELHVLVGTVLYFEQNEWLIDTVSELSCRSFLAFFASRERSSSHSSVR